MKKRKICLFIISSLFLLTSCNDSNNEYKFDEDIILVKDFTIKDAKRCTKAYLKEKYNKESLGGLIIDFLYYLGRYQNNSQIVMFRICSYDDGYKDSATYPLDSVDGIEIVDDITFNWFFENKILSLHPKFVINSDIYSVKDAYMNNLLTHDDLLTLNDIWMNKRSEYQLFYRFVDVY